MRHGSLFSGIGGFDLAAEWMGWENVFHCEWNEFGQKVLKYYWPNAISYGDITKTDFTIHRGGIDILTGGFPCQPFSLAGKRKGTADDRHLWPEMLRCIREVQPTWVVGENVYGLINWDGGMVFDQVQSDMECEGYEVQPIILPACSVNAPRRGDKQWGKNSFRERSIYECQGEGRDEIRPESERSGKSRITSDTINSRHTNGHTETRGEEQCSEQRGMQQLERNNNESNVSNTDCIRLQGRMYENREKRTISKFNVTTSDTRFSRTNWQDFPTQSPLCSRNDGISSRLAGITFPKHRNESIKGYGNAIVPQVVFEIFKVIEEMSNDADKSYP
jgi:DNA (cytosine-5)-methyltransferase 1